MREVSLLLMVLIMPKITTEMTNDKNKDIRSKGLRNGEVMSCEEGRR
jgi:hypothetical protein